MNIPRNLPDTFDRVLQRIESKGNAEVVRNVFKWTAAACYPLTLEQLSEVLNIKIKQSNSQESRHVNGINHLPTWCENLIQVEDGSETVHFSHHSIRSYLLGPTRKAVLDFDLDLEYCEDFIGDICLTYLNFSDFQTALTVKSSERLMNPGHIPLGVVDQTLNTLGAKSHGRRIARLVQMPFGKPQRTVLSKSLPLGGINISTESTTAKYFPFLQYAQDNWSRHTVRISPSSKTWSLWQRMDVTASYAPWTNLEWQTPGIAPLDHYAEADDSTSTASMQKLAHDDFLTCFSLHKAIAFSHLLDHQQLLAKVISKFIEYKFTANPRLLGRLFQTTAVQNFYSSSSFNTKVGAHELVIDCVTRYTASGGQKWPHEPYYGTGNHLCSQPLQGECRKTIHEQSARILGGADINITKEMQARAEASIIDFNEEIFARLAGNILLEYPKDKIPRIFRIAIERGSPWSFTAIDALLHNEEPQQKRYLSLVETLVEFQDIDTLTYLVELRHSPSYEGPNLVQLVVLEDVLMKNAESELAATLSVSTPNWDSTVDSRQLRLPSMLRQRLIELCIPSSCGHGLSKLRGIFMRAIWTSSWDIAAALHSCILTSMPTAHSAFEPILPHERDAIELLDGTLGCLTEVSRPCQQWLRMGNPFLLCCEEHRSRVSVMASNVDNGLRITSPNLFRVLEKILVENKAAGYG